MKQGDGEYFLGRINLLHWMMRVRTASGGLPHILIKDAVAIVKSGRRCGSLPMIQPQTVRRHSMLGIPCRVGISASASCIKATLFQEVASRRGPGPVRMTERVLFTYQSIRSSSEQTLITVRDDRGRGVIKVEENVVEG